MKFSSLAYAKAFTRAIAENPEQEAELRKKFLATVEKHGDVAAFPKIIQEITRLTDHATKTRRVLVESARPLSDTHLRELRSAFGKQSMIEVSAVPELVAGVRITIDGEHVIDATLAGRTKKLFT